MDIPALPLPGEKFDEKLTVVASVWVNDDEGTALLLVLTDSPPYYNVVDIEAKDGKWEATFATQHPNINPAVEEYAQRGGDY